MTAKSLIIGLFLIIYSSELLGQSCEVSGLTATAYIDAANNGTVSADLSWDALGIGESYQVYYNTAGIGSVLAPTVSTTSLKLEQLQANSDYIWKARVMCNGEWGSWPTAWAGSFTTPEEVVEYAIEWKELINMTVEADNHLVKSSASNAWDAGATSYNLLAGGEEGFIEFTIDHIGHVFMVGLSTEEENTNYTSIDHGFYIDANGILRIFESGGQKLTHDLVNVGDIFRIEREGEFVKYFKNGNEIYSSANPLTEELVLDVSIYQGEMPVIMSSFDAKLELVPTVIPASASTPGSISLAVAGGDGNYSYLWSSGETIAGITQPVGNYSVTVTDGKGRSATVSYYLGYEVAWKELINMTVENGNHLVKSSTSNAWDAGSTSYNLLAGGEEGFIEFTIDHIGHVFMVGLSTEEENTNYTSIDHGLYFDANGITRVFESGSQKLIHDLVNVGDIFRIEREGEFVKYFKNGNEIYSSANPLIEELVLDVSIYQGEMPVIMSSFDVSSATFWAISDGNWNDAQIWSLEENGAATDRVPRFLEM